jgi:hypothetical protein
MGFVFAMTGGRLGQVVSAKDGASSSSLLLGGVAGLLVVAIARVEAISHNTALATALQGLLISAPAAATFVLFADGNLLTQISESSQAASRDFILLLLGGAAVVSVLVEVAFHALDALGPEEFRRVPLWLVRQRIEQWEAVEQVWSPWRIVSWTGDWIEKVVKTEGVQRICWLTNVHPLPLLQMVAAASGEEPPQLTRKLRIVVPEAVWSRFETELRQDRKWSAALGSLQVRLLAGKVSPRIRLLILNSRAAIVHLPIEHHQDDWDEASNYAAVVTDPARISEVKAWFEQIWRDAIKLGGGGRVSAAGHGPWQGLSH